MKRSRKLLTTAITCAILVCALIICAVASSAAGENKFIDVPEAWYTNAVLEVNELGIMTGTSKTTFEPLNDLTRAEYVAILFRLSEGEENLEYTFTDVPKGAWYKKYVGWAEQTGIINGYDGDSQRFAGGEKITREQLMVMTARYMKYEWISFEDSPSAVEFKDKAKIASWAADGVEVTRKAGLVQGDKNGNFNPRDNATRAEIATIVTRYLDALPNARDEMFMKIENLTELMECENGYPVLKLGKSLPLRQNRADSIGEIILPQMGLDTDVYQLIMDDQQYHSFSDTYQRPIFDGNMDVGESQLILANFAIKNTETGEITEHYLYLFNVYYTAIEIDPLTYDVDLPADVHGEMMEASFDSIGNVARLAKVFERAEAGENLTVAYIGGSLTQAGGADPNGNWASGTTAWLSRKFPNSDVTGINAGIGGTNSDYGAVRLQNHVLNYDPDIVFVEFSVNDSSDSDYCKQSMEGIVRTCLEYGDDTAVIIVLTANGEVSDGMAKGREMHKNLAAYYGLPVVDFLSGLTVGMDAGEFTFGDLSLDGCHLMTWGYQVELDMVEYLLENICEKIESATAAELTVKPLPSTLFAPGDRFIGLTTIDRLNDDAITTLGSWKEADSPYEDDIYKNGWSCSGKDGNAPLEFTFTGTDLYIQMYTAGDENDPVKLTITLNDGEKVYTYGPTGRPYRVFENLEEKEYKVSITVANPKDGVEPLIFAITYR